MPSRLLHVFTGLLGLLLFAGCVTTNPRSPQSNSAPTAPALGPTGHAPAPTAPAAPAQPAPRATPPAPLPAATIVGSEESSALLDNFTAFVTAIDDRPVKAGRAGWNVPVPMAPGRHRIRVEFNRGNFSAHTELELVARPGGSYRVMQSSDAQLYGNSSYCEFWIVDIDSGISVAPAKRTDIVNQAH